jgi:hypothetical protein
MCKERKRYHSSESDSSEREFKPKDSKVEISDSSDSSIIIDMIEKFATDSVDEKHGEEMTTLKEKRQR